MRFKAIKPFLIRLYQCLVYFPPRGLILFCVGYVALRTSYPYNHFNSLDDAAVFNNFFWN